MKYLGEVHNTHLKAAITICIPISFVRSCDILENNFLPKKFYNDTLAADLRQIVLEKHE